MNRRRRLLLHHTFPLAVALLLLSPFHGRAAEAPRTNTNALEQAQATLQAGQLTEALKQFQDLTRQRPDSAAAHFGFGEALAVIGQMDAARAELKAADELLAKTPHTALAQRVRLRRGQLELTFGDRAEGRALLLRLGEDSAGDFAMMLRLANLLSAHSEYRVARQLAEKLPPQHGDAEIQRRLRLAFLRERDGDANGAMNAYRSALSQLSPASDRRFYVIDQLLRIARREGRLRELCEEWRPAAANSQALRDALIRAYVELSDYAPAFKLARGDRARDASEQQAEILIRAGLAGQDKWAREQFDAQLKRDPKNMLWQVNLVRLLADLDRKDELLRVAKQLLEAKLTPADDSPRRWVELGEALRYAGATEALFKCATRAVAAIARTGKVANARRMLDAADFKALDWAASLHEAHGRREAIPSLLKRFEQQAGVDPNARLQLAELYARHTLWSEFDRLWSEIRSLPLRDDILLRIAYILENGGRRQEGLQLWTKLSTESHDRLTRDQASAHVAELQRLAGTYEAYLQNLEKKVASGRATDIDRQLLTRAYLAEINVKQNPRSGQRTDALAKLTKFYRDECARRPRDVRFLDEAATFFADRGDVREVESLTRRLVTTNPADAMTYRKRLVQTLAERGTEQKFEKALAELTLPKEEACAMHLFRARALSLAASTRATNASPAPPGGAASTPAAQKVAVAVRYLERAIDETRAAFATAKLSQDKSSALLTHAQALSTLGRASDAVALLRFHVMTSDDSRVVQRLGEEFLARSQPFNLRWTAMALCRLIGDEPYLPQLHYQLAVVRAELGDKQYASLRDAVDLSVDQRAVWLRELVERTKADNNAERTLALIRELLACENDLPPGVAMEYGKFALNRGDEKLADRAFEGILRYGAQAPVLEALGDVYLNAGRYSRAMTVYERGTRLAPDSPSLLFKTTLLAEIRGAPRDKVSAGYARALLAAVEKTPLTTGATSEAAPPQPGSVNEERVITTRIQQGFLSSSVAEERLRLVAQLRQRLVNELDQLKTANRLNANMTSHPRLQMVVQFISAIAPGAGASEELAQVQKLTEANFPDDPTIFERLLAEKRRSDPEGAKAMINARLQSGKAISSATLVNYLLSEGRGDEARQHWHLLVRDMLEQSRSQPGGMHTAIYQVMSVTQMLFNGMSDDQKKWEFAAKTVPAIPMELRGRFILDLATKTNARDRALPVVIDWLRQPVSEVDTNFQYQFKSFYQFLSFEGRRKLRDELNRIVAAADAPWHAKFCALLLAGDSDERVTDIVSLAESSFPKFAGQPSHVLMQFMREIWNVTEPNERPRLLEAYFQFLAKQTHAQEGMVPGFQFALLYGLDVSNPSVLAVLTKRIPQLDGDGFRRVLEMSLSRLGQDAGKNSLTTRLCDYALERDPNDPVALLVAAVSALRTGDKETGLKHAVAAFGQIGTITRERQQMWQTVLPSLMSALQQANLTSELRARIEKLATESRNSPEFQLALVQMLQLEGRRTDQTAILKRAFENNADSSVLFKAYAQLLVDAGQYFAAREAAERYMERRPSATRLIGDYAYPDHEVQALLQRIYTTLLDKRGEYRAARFMANFANGTFGGVQPPTPQQALAAGEIEEARGLAIQHHFNDPIRVALAIPAFNRPEDPSLFLAAMSTLPTGTLLTFANYVTCAEMYDRLGVVGGLTRNIDKALRNPQSAIRAQRPGDNPQSLDRFHLLALLAAARSLEGDYAAAAIALDEAVNLINLNERPNALQWNADLCELHLRGGNVSRAWALADAMPDNPGGAMRLASIDERLLSGGRGIGRGVIRMSRGSSTTIVTSGTVTSGTVLVVPPPPPPPLMVSESASVNHYKWRILDRDLRSPTPDAALDTFAKFAKPERDFYLGVKLAWRLAGMGKSAAAEQLIARLAAIAETDAQRRMLLDSARAVVELMAGRADENTLLLHASRMSATFGEFAVPSDEEAPVGVPLLRAAATMGPRISMQPLQHSDLDVRLVAALARAGARTLAKEVAERSLVFGRSSAENDALRATLLQLAGETTAAQEIFDRLFELRTLPITAFLAYANVIGQRDANRAHEVLALAAENSDHVDILKSFAQSCLDRNNRATAAKIVARLHWTAPRNEEIRELERRVKLRTG